MTRQEFETFVQDAVEKLPAEIRAKLENVQFIVAETPHRRQSHLGELYGLYEGIPFPDRGPDFQLAMPDRITLFKRTIERDSPTREEIIRCIQDTVIHEVGHFLGLDEEDLERRGLG
jgi:predicted Zn-dependent protease with MMP-like domain